MKDAASGKIGQVLSQDVCQFIGITDTGDNAVDKLKGSGN